MTYGLDLGKLRLDGTGSSYIDFVPHSGGSTIKAYTSEAIGLATYFTYFICPAQNIGSTTVAIYPSVAISRAGSTITVTISGGDATVNVLIFMG